MFACVDATLHVSERSPVVPLASLAFPDPDPDPDARPHRGSISSAHEASTADESHESAVSCCPYKRES